MTRGCGADGALLLTGISDSRGVQPRRRAAWAAVSGGPSGPSSNNGSSSSGGASGTGGTDAGGRSGGRLGVLGGWLGRAPSSFHVHPQSATVLTASGDDPSSSPESTRGRDPAARSGERTGSHDGLASCSHRAAAAAQADIGTDSFNVRASRRAFPPTLPATLLLPAPVAGDVSDFLDEEDLVLHANNLRHAIVSKLQLIRSMQRQGFHQLERAARWVSQRRTGREYGGDSRSDGGGHFHASRKEEHRLAEQAFQAERACDPKRSMELYTQLVELHPTAEMYARLSKQYTDMMYLPGTSSQQVVELNSKAVDTAKQAVGLDAGCPLAHIALCVSRGRLALVSDNRTKVQLARDAADDAAEALRLDPHSDLAHHLMGRWHFEMAQLGPFARYLIKILFGTSLMNGSFPEALEHYRTARELNPERLIHRVEVGRLLMKLGNSQEAMEELHGSLSMDIEDINARLQREDAAELLRQIERSGKWGMFMRPPDEASKSGQRNGTNDGRSPPPLQPRS